MTGSGWFLCPLPLCRLRTTQSIPPPGDQQLLAGRYFHKEGYAPDSLARNVSKGNSEEMLADLPFHGFLTFVSKKLSGYVFLVIILASKNHQAGGGLGPLPCHPREEIKNRVDKAHQRLSSKGIKVRI